MLTVTIWLWQCTLFLVFGRNGLVYDFSTLQSCDEIHIFRLTLIWSRNMTLTSKIRLRLGRKFTFLLSMQRCSQGRKCVLDLIDGLWGLIIDVCLALNECLHCFSKFLERDDAYGGGFVVPWDDIVWALFSFLQLKFEWFLHPGLYEP